MFNTGADRKEPIAVPAVQVVKIGGSVLKRHADYLRAAEFVRRRAAQASCRLVVVVSARRGETDELLRLAEQLTPSPDRRTLDLLWSCGEMRSVALLALCLQRLGIPALGLNAHETGLELLQDGCDGSVGAPAKRLRLLKWIDRHPALIVPGFFATTRDRTLTSLGRGGSDLAALLIAYALRASGCELIKDVAGYFDRDPNRFGNALPLTAISYRQALEMARNGCDLVQHEALESACRLGIPLLVRGLESSQPGTWVGDHLGRGLSPRNSPQEISELCNDTLQPEFSVS